MSWLLVAIALKGTVMNVRRMRLGFVFWAVSNLGLSWVNAAIGEWAQSILFAIYFTLAVIGWLAWGDKTHTTHGAHGAEREKPTCQSRV